jgi:hypothetical protein
LIRGCASSKKEIQARKQDFNNDWKFSLGEFSSTSAVNFDDSF